MPSFHTVPLTVSDLSKLGQAIAFRQRAVLAELTGTDADRIPSIERAGELNTIYRGLDELAARLALHEAKNKLQEAQPIHHLPGVSKSEALRRADKADQLRRLAAAGGRTETGAPGTFAAPAVAHARSRRITLAAARLAKLVARDAPDTAIIEARAELNRLKSLPNPITVQAAAGYTFAQPVSFSPDESTEDEGFKVD